ncbi:MAG: GNAT family N-acetyltransferase [Thermoguttaceae bacterium]|nr:GNAT family N-acetyltransferase [Thermoguttaceae bacterium]
MSSVNNVAVRILPEAQIDASLDAKLRAYLIELFPNWDSIFRTRRAWHEATPVFTVLATDASENVVGHVAVVERAISTEWNVRYAAASFQGVSVLPPYRRQGLASRLLDAALDESRRLGYQFAILFCREPLVKFYERNGWKLPYDPMIMWRDRELPVHMQSDYPMYRELTSQPIPEGQLDVHNPFDYPASLGKKETS